VTAELSQASPALAPPAIEPASRDALLARIHEVVRFSLPFNAAVAVLSEGDSRLLDLEGRDTWHLPETAKGTFAGPFPLNGIDAVSQLERLRAKGAQYLLVPRTAFWWMDYADAFRKHVSSRYRAVLREEDACLIVALHDNDFRELRDQVDDGLPLPPPEMLGLVIGEYNPLTWLQGGVAVANSVGLTLTKNGVRMDSLDGIVDFGCGSGRVIRRWKAIDHVGLHGVDYNPYLVEWCRRTLPFATFERNRSMVPLSLEDESVDLVYSYSVFTHLDQESQFFWMNELSRIVRPGGHVLITVHGTAYLNDLSQEDRERFEAGEMLVKEGHYSGSSACYTFHPQQYFRDVLAPELELIDFVPGSPQDETLSTQMQDAILMRKP
jgi:SAM-dependent methyltransferase